MADNNTVLVTGANGFVAMHILRELIERGHKVLAIVRSAARAQDILELHPQWRPSISFDYVSDIAVDGAFCEVFKKHQDKVDYVLHTASPVTFAVTDLEKELIEPAVRGVKDILQDAHEFGGGRIKRFVLLASAVEVLNSFEDTSKPGKPYNEEDWNPVTTEDAIKAHSPVLAYNAGKKLGEQAAWQFVSSARPSFDLVTINPDIIVGPPLQNVSKPAALNETNMFAVYNFFNGTYKRVEDTAFPFYHFVDVRDVALATVAAMSTPGASGHRILLVADVITPQLIVNIIRKHFPQLNDRLTAGGNETQIFPVGVNPTGWDVSRSSAILSQWDGLKGEKWEYCGLEKSVVDTVEKILELENQWAQEGIKV